MNERRITTTKMQDKTRPRPKTKKDHNEYDQAQGSRIIKTFKSKDKQRTRPPKGKIKTIPRIKT
jgi:hypothetical protein